MDVDKIMEALSVLAPHSDVAGHHSGKIELKFRLSAMNALAGRNWADLIESIPGILSSRLQLFSRRIVIDYDPGILPDDLWQDIVRLKAEPELAPHIRKRLQALSSHEKA
jgi:hypothetical protein